MAARHAGISVGLTRRYAGTEVQFRRLMRTKCIFEHLVLLKAAFIDSGTRVASNS